MAYSFNLLGISPILDFFSHQQNRQGHIAQGGAAYVGTHECKLDTFIRSVEEVSPPRGWNLDQAVDAVIQYWMTNEGYVRHWQQRLQDAGQESLPKIWV
ncbi:hypothetical protein [Prochlorothrix hollandica]|uniref:hypothetical protein n=1 Tax=Prochlorothrix hollandica TaxID=1223 RepID=UPI00333EC44D